MGCSTRCSSACRARAAGGTGSGQGRFLERSLAAQESAAVTSLVDRERSAPGLAVTGPGAAPRRRADADHRIRRARAGAPWLPAGGTDRSAFRADGDSGLPAARWPSMRSAPHSLSAGTTRRDHVGCNRGRLRRLPGAADSQTATYAATNATAGHTLIAGPSHAHPSGRRRRGSRSPSQQPRPSAPATPPTGAGTRAGPRTTHHGRADDHPSPRTATPPRPNGSARAGSPARMMLIRGRRGDERDERYDRHGDHERQVVDRHLPFCFD